MRVSKKDLHWMSAVKKAVSAVPGRKPAKELNTIQAAHYLSLTRQTMMNWRARGYGPKFRKSFGTIKYQLEDIDKFMERARIPVQQIAESERLMSEATQRASVLATLSLPDDQEINRSC